MADTVKELLLHGDSCLTTFLVVGVAAWAVLFVNCAKKKKKEGALPEKKSREKIERIPVANDLRQLIETGAAHMTKLVNDENFATTSATLYMEKIEDEKKKSENQDNEQNFTSLKDQQLESRYPEHRKILKRTRVTDICGRRTIFHANYIEKNREIIASMVFSRYELPRMWEFVHASELRAIVDLANLAEHLRDNQEKPYFPMKKGAYDENYLLFNSEQGTHWIDVLMKKDFHQDGFVERDLLICVRDKKQERATDWTVRHYYYDGWPAKGEKSVSDCRGLDKLAFFVYWHHIRKGEKVLVHCKEGGWRTGVFILTLVLLKRFFGSPDFGAEEIAEAAVEVEISRPGMLITKPNHVKDAIELMEKALRSESVRLERDRHEDNLKEVTDPLKENAIALSLRRGDPPVKLSRLIQPQTTFGNLTGGDYHQQWQRKMAAQAQKWDQQDREIMDQQNVDE